MTLELGIALAVGYLLGSIPFGLLLTRMAGLGDIRDIGSGNIGATNVLRTGNKLVAAATLILDAGKAIAAVLIVRAFIPDPPLAYSLAGVAAFMGHIFPVWLGFKGGKGVATYIGVLLAINWVIGFIFCGIWLMIAVTIRISSVSALSAAVAMPFFAFILSGPHLAIGTLFMSAMLFFTHRENIKQVIAGTEPKIGGGKNKAS